MSDIEGKVAREAMSECGQRASFNPFGVERGKGPWAPCAFTAVGVFRFKMAINGVFPTYPSFL
jgi:hypothetical protein